LLAAQKKVRPNNGSIRLVSLQPFVREVFEMTGFNRLFAIHPNQSDALKGTKQ
jgi:anti-anti-sigma factor